MFFCHTLIRTMKLQQAETEPLLMLETECANAHTDTIQQQNATIQSFQVGLAMCSVNTTS